MGIIDSIKRGDSQATIKLVEQILFRKAGMLVEQHKQTFCSTILREDEDEEGGETRIKTTLSHYQEDDLVAMAKAKLGWAIAEQLEGILSKDEPLEDQNANALARIVEWLDKKGEDDLADEIADYLEKVMKGRVQRGSREHKEPGEPDHEWLENHDKGDFCDMVVAEYGDAIGDQAKSILNGEDMEEQNPNALRHIMDFARKKGEMTLAGEIKKYLADQGRK